MKLTKPKLSKVLKEDVDLQSAIQQGIEDEEDIEGSHFDNSYVENVQVRNIEFNDCIFENCNFIKCKLNKVFFVDVVFESCDISNIDFESCIFHRVEFRNCKAVGANFAGTDLNNMLMTNCNCKYKSIFRQFKKYIIR